MGKSIFLGIMTGIACTTVSLFVEGRWMLGIIGFVFVNMMSLTFGMEINKGSDSNYFKRN